MLTCFSKGLGVLLAAFMPIAYSFAECSELPSAKFPPLQYAEKVSTAGAAEDLRILETTLRTNHPSIFDYQSNSEFEKLVTDLVLKSACVNTSIDVFALASQMVASIGDAHTYVINPLDIEILTREPLFPIDVNLINNEFFIGEKQVASINDLSSELILQSLQAYLPSDANATPYKNAYIEQDFALLFFIFLDRSSHFKVKFIDGTNTVISATVKQIQKKSANELLPSLKITGTSATLKIPSWEDSSASSFNTPLAETAQNTLLGKFIVDAMSEIMTKDINKLVVDLRGNKGGKSGPAALLLSFLINEPFKYYKEISVASGEFPTYEHIANKSLVDFYKSEQAKNLIEFRNGRLFFKPELVPEISPQEYTFDGDLVLLVDKFSLSVSTDVVANLLQHTTAKVEGDEIGGSLAHYSAGNYLDLVLPNSKVRVNVPLQRLVY